LDATVVTCAKTLKKAAVSVHCKIQPFPLPFGHQLAMPLQVLCQCDVILIFLPPFFFSVKKEAYDFYYV
jgi:hypothetical protein